MQYENNLIKKKLQREKKKQQKQDLVFKKPKSSKRYKKGDPLIIRVVLYSGQYGSFLYNNPVVTSVFTLYIRHT